MSLVIQFVSASTLQNFKELQSITDPLLLLEEMKSYIGPILILALINILFTTMLQYYVIYNPLDKENNIIAAPIRSIKYFIPYLIILVLLAFLGSFAILLGLVVLIIGVFFSILYLMTLYLFILPILMVEGPNIGNTISRTFTLTHRNFWSNIGWVAVLIIIMIIVSVILSAVILLPFSGSFLRTIINPAEASEFIDMTTKPVFIILSAVSSAITLPVMPIFACILYFNARAREDQAQIATADYPDNRNVSVDDLYAKPYSDEKDENQEST
jgi:hypothetical protein